MEFPLIIIAILVIVGIIIAVKLIKKVLFLVFSIFLIFILAIGSVAGLVYLDFKNLSSQKDFKVNLIVSKEGENLYGIQIPFENKTPIKEDVIGISSKLKELDMENIESEKEFYIIFDQEVLEDLVKGREFNFNTIINFPQLEGYDLTFTDKEIMKVLNSNNPEDDFIDISFENVDLPEILKDSVKPIAKETLINELSKRNLDIKEVLFSLVLAEISKDSKNYLNLVTYYKDGKIQVYPDRLVFKLVKLIPSSIIQEQINAINNRVSSI